jgi:Ca-activated chloride channel family protein
MTMNIEPLGPELTAFALNDPSLTDAQKIAIEQRLATDPAARQLVEETRSVGQFLAESMAVNVEPVEDSPMGHTVAATLEKKRGKGMLPWWATALAACVAFCIGVMLKEGSFSKHAQLTPPPVVADATPYDGPFRIGSVKIEGNTHTENRVIEHDLGKLKADELLDLSQVQAAEQTLARRGIFDQNTPPKILVVPSDRGEQFKNLVVQVKESRTGVVGLQVGVNSNAGLSGSTGTPSFSPMVSLQPGGSTYTGATTVTSGTLSRGQFQGGGFGGGGQFNGGFGGGFQGGATIPPTPGWYSGTKQGSDLRVNPATGLIYDASDKADPNNPGYVSNGKPEPANLTLPAFTGRGTTDPQSRDAYPQLIENAFTEVKGQDALSTFGVDVDTASYSIVRNYLNHNQLPPANAVRLEEMINYFPYKDAPPEGNDPFAVRVEMAECPWQPKHRLARIALKAKPIDNSKRPKSNLVFLIDVSGSMDAPNRLPLVKAAMKLLVGQLGENDRVAIVVYAGASGLVLDSTNCGNPETILKALDNLTPGGSTNGASGIQLAYEVAVKNFVEKGTNRVILCTDGDWNVGTTSTDALIKLIEEKRKTGVFLSVFGFGMGNLRDEMMVQLAGKGNGNYGYIDSLAEAKKALVEQISGTLVTVAKDVKIQIEFNPARVASYRLIGYEKRILAAKDFSDDKKDAGEMGAGHVVTALYELVPTEAAHAEPKIDGLRYQPKVEAPKAPADDKTSKEAFVLKLRHKMPDKDESTLREIPVGDVAKSYDKATDDFQFASAVAAFGMLLKNSQYKAQANYALVEELVAASLTNDPGAYRAEFLQLVKKAKALSGGK